MLGLDRNQIIAAIKQPESSAAAAAAEVTFRGEIAPTNGNQAEEEEEEQEAVGWGGGEREQ